MFLATDIGKTILTLFITEFTDIDGNSSSGKNFLHFLFFDLIDLLLVILNSFLSYKFRLLMLCSLVPLVCQDLLRYYW